MTPGKLSLRTGLPLVAALMVLAGVQQCQLHQLRQQQTQRTDGVPPGPDGQSIHPARFRLPAPLSKEFPIPPVKPTDSKAAEIYALFHVPKLSIAQAEKFVGENQRSASSLTAAFRTSGEKRFLTEAMGKYPHDPQVAFEALFKADLTPADRRNWIEALKQASPENSLGHYLSAQDYFKSGQTDLAVGELEAAFGQTKFDDLTLERMQINEEAYRANGFSEAESRNVAMFQLDLPLLNEMKSLTQNMVALSKSYLQDGDRASADATVAITLKLGEHFRNEGNALLVHQMLGIGMEQAALKTLDPGTTFTPAGQTPQALLDTLKAHEAEFSSLVRETVPLQDRMSPQDWIGYIDRMKLLGESNAMRWLKTKYGPP